MWSVATDHISINCGVDSSMNTHTHTHTHTHTQGHDATRHCNVVVVSCKMLQCCCRLGVVVQYILCSLKMTTLRSCVLVICWFSRPSFCQSTSDPAVILNTASRLRTVGLHMMLVGVLAWQRRWWKLAGWLEIVGIWSGVRSSIVVGGGLGRWFPVICSGTGVNAATQIWLPQPSRLIGRAITTDYTHIPTHKVTTTMFPTYLQFPLHVYFSSVSTHNPHTVYSQCFALINSKRLSSAMTYDLHL